MQNTITPTPIKAKRTDLQQQVTDIIIGQLEKGIVPWEKPWIGNDMPALSIPKNNVTKNRYRGINILLLWGSALDRGYATQDWASFKQWQQKGETVNKGEKGNLVVYYDTFDREEDGEIKKIPFLKSSYVFNRCQLSSYQPETVQPELPKEPLVKRLESVEQFVHNTKALIEHGGGRACYIPSQDKIRMPSVEDFIGTATCTATESYYSVLLHELTHWSGNPKRLDRTKGKQFGDNNYATEELVAELGAAFLSAELEITQSPKEDHAAYIANWLEVLKNNKQCVFSAASEASKAVDYLQALQSGI